MVPSATDNEMEKSGHAGRFAPSPTGDLHFGSLLAAMASFCDARSMGALWRLRIDDIDGPRSVPGSAERIQSSLKDYGLHWHGELLLQSLHAQRYLSALSTLIETGCVFTCHCSRRQLPQGQPYPGSCRSNRLHSINDIKENSALRLILPASINFEDGVQGMQQVATSDTVGDIIIWRRDKLVSYSLACAVDDALDCTDVVRGADLLSSTAAQLAIMQYLHMTPPNYSHIPIAVDANNDKLSKHSKATAIDDMDKLATLNRAWKFLGQRPITVSDIPSFWTAAVDHWQLSDVPKSVRTEVSFE